MNTMPSFVDVLIVGAGPTGLTLACDLARRNVDHRIIERSTFLSPDKKLSPLARPPCRLMLMTRTLSHSRQTKTHR